jgi:hypothetical protein
MVKVEGLPRPPDLMSRCLQSKSPMAAGALPDTATRAKSFQNQSSKEPDRTPIFLGNSVAGRAAIAIAHLFF